MNQKHVKSTKIFVNSVSEEFLLKNNESKQKKKVLQRASNITHKIFSLVMIVECIHKNHYLMILY